MALDMLKIESLYKCCPVNIFFKKKSQEELFLSVMLLYIELTI